LSRSSRDTWKDALRNCADPARARHFAELLAPSSKGAFRKDLAPEQARVLAAVLSGSQALGNLLVARPDLLGMLDVEGLRFPRRKQGLANEVEAWLRPALAARDYPAALKQVREFKQREMLRIAARDLARLGKVGEITLEISNVADVCLSCVWRTCFQRLAERHGWPYHQDAHKQWQRTEACLLGLGKLGGQELNYSSDVDVMFLYSEEGSVFKEPPLPGTKPRPSLSNHQLFNRLAENFVGEVAALAPEGALYRIDLRLRPEGDAGPLSRSLAGYENYYAQWGQTWERMMLIKARGVAGDEALAAEFLELVQPFRYPRSVNPSFFREVSSMKARIENEVVKAGELERNVKLGRGGIREIEFIVQTLQVLHGGRRPFLQNAQTLACLEKLAQYELLTAHDCRALAQAYEFLREVEHRLQMEDNRQTHTIPIAHAARLRLARLMGCKTMENFDDLLPQHTSQVRRIFDRIFQDDPGQQSEAGDVVYFPGQFERAAAQWKQCLGEHGFKDAETAWRMLREFVEGPGYVHVSPRTSELGYQLLGQLLARLRPGRAEGRAPSSNLLPKTNPNPNAAVDRSKARPNEGALPGGAQPLGRFSDPDRVVKRLDSFISAYGARGQLFELWNRHPEIFDLLLLLFDRSEFLAELAIRTPDMVDELVTSGRLRQRKSAEETLRDLRHGLDDEDQFLWLRRYQPVELMRIGLRDILGLADFEQYLVELSALADACLQYALEAVLRRHKLKQAPFVIIGLGKLGGAEIDYGSDLDIIFVAKDKAKDLSRLLPRAIEVMDLLSQRTGQGIVFHTDARLRPDGEKGLLVNTLGAFEQYYRKRAQLWEIQSLTRARPVAGDLKLGEEFQRLAGVLTNFAAPSLPLAAFTPDWKQRIDQMRIRIEKERTPPGKDALAIKTGQGGLMDAEFIGQTLCLANGWQEPNTLRALERGRTAGVLPQADKLIANYRQLRRIEGILRRWSYEGETVLPDDPAPYERVAVRCGFASPAAFRGAVGEYRQAIREVYRLVFTEGRGFS